MMTNQEHRPEHDDAIDSPPPASVRKLVLAGGPAEIPPSFIVPAFRHWFDSEFNYIREKVHTAPDGTVFDQHQGGVGCCTGMGARMVKTDHEGTAISCKDAWNIAKRIDAEWGHPLEAYGGTLWAAIMALDVGVAEESVVPTVFGPGGQMEFLNMDSYLDDKVKANRELHKGAGKPYYTDRNGMISAVWTTGHACITSLQWYSEDNFIDEFIGPPKGTLAGGHRVACIGQMTSSMKLPSEYTRNKRGGSPAICPPTMKLALTSILPAIK